VPTTVSVRRRALGAVAAVALVATLTACGGGDVKVAVHDGGSAATAGPASKGTDRPTTAADDKASPTASKAPTVPPGDPGPDAPGTDDPNGDLGNDGSTPPKHPAKTTVPRAAVLDAETVASVAGGTWTDGSAPADTCAAPRPARAVATRSVQLVSGSDGTSGSQLVETIGTHRGTKAAVAAVHALQARLLGCHAKPAPDPRIGDASVQLTLAAADGTPTVVTAAAIEGVTFVLSGSGPVTGVDTWSALTDIALGSTCAAAVDGCH
jgi:hypothetical protein